MCIRDRSKATLAIHDPPYNLVAFEERSVEEYVTWCRQWIDNTAKSLGEDASLYIWLGADQTCDFQPLPDFILMMRQIKEFQARSFITVRNPVSYTHLRAHETVLDLVCRLLLEKKKINLYKDKVQDTNILHLLKYVQLIHSLDSTLTTM